MNLILCVRGYWSAAEQGGCAIVSNALLWSDPYLLHLSTLVRPLPPVQSSVCLIGWTIITLFQAYAERETALYAVAMVAVSWPVYRYLARK